MIVEALRRALGTGPGRGRRGPAGPAQGPARLGESPSAYAGAESLKFSRCRAVCVGMVRAVRHWRAVLHFRCLVPCNVGALRVVYPLTVRMRATIHIWKGRAVCTERTMSCAFFQRDERSARLRAASVSTVISAMMVRQRCSDAT